MAISQKDAVVRSEVYKANMELVRELVAFNFPEVAAPLRTVDRSAYHDVMLRQIQVKNEPKFLSLLIRNNRMDEAEEILACPHPAISHAIYEAIRWAAQEGRIVALERLLKDPRANINFKRHDEPWRPLHLAVAKGRTEIVDLLLRHNAEVTTKELREAVFRHFNDIVKQLAPQSEPDDSVLHAACESGNWEMQDIIVRSFPDIPVTANTLHWAIYGGNIDIAYDILTNRNVDPMEYVVMEGENAWFNALDTAAQYGQPEIVAMLLENPRVDPSWNRNQAVRLAAKRNFPNIVLQILHHPLPVRRSFLLKWVKNFQQKTYVRRFVHEGHRENHNALTDAEKAVVEYVGGSLADYERAAWHAIGERQWERQDGQDTDQ